MAAPERSTGVRRRLPSSSKLDDVATSSISRPGLDTESHSLASRLWLESRLVPGTTSEYRPPGEDRPFTIANIRLAIRLIRLVGYRFLSLFIAGQEYRVGIYIMGAVSRGILPTLKIWASSQMLDLVQASFESKSIDPANVWRTAIISVACSAGDDVVRYLLRSNDASVKTHVNTVLERAYLSTQLSMSIPSLSTPYVSALMTEGGIFAGFERSPDGVQVGGPFDTISSIFNLLTSAISIFSQIWLMIKALSNGGGANIGWSSVILITLSLAPSFIRTISPLLRRRDFTRHRWDDIIRHRTARNIKTMGGNNSYKQEIMLFGLKDWVLERWDRAKREIEDDKVLRQRDSAPYDLGLGMFEESVRTSFYVLLSLRVLPTNLSLGSIRLYERTAGSLLSSLRSISMTANRVFQVTFLITAYLEAIALPDAPHLLRSAEVQNAELVDYENHRVEDGMGLIATNLSFRYPNTTKDVLHDINITIKPGSTLAVVGFNGGGKTTLVKVLTGLYEYQGSLKLNNQQMSSFDPISLHRRTSVLFQDFSKYSLTLRENVGVGLYEKMSEDDSIKEAINKGGAEAILEKQGMEGRLSRSGLSDAVGTSGDIQLKSDEPKHLIRDRKKALRSQKLWDQSIDLIKSSLSWIDELAIFKSPMNPGSPNDNAPSSEEEKAKGALDTIDSGQDIGQVASLSGGQWQRVALSRAFMRAHEADLVVFDEPSSSLDPRAEAEIFDKIHSLSHQQGRKCTTIFISHRFSTVKKADQIAVVENGTITECGQHDELMAKMGRYAELYNLQKAGFDD